jgi:hypothetical protein
MLVARSGGLRASLASRRHSAAYLKDSSLLKSSCGSIAGCPFTKLASLRRQQTKAAIGSFSIVYIQAVDSNALFSYG